jgi:hypothetical protein
MRVPQGGTCPRFWLPYHTMRVRPQLGTLEGVPGAIVSPRLTSHWYHLRDATILGAVTTQRNPLHVLLGQACTKWTGSIQEADKPV